MRNIIISSGKMDNISLCKLRSNYEVVMNLEPKERQISSKMDQGSFVHKLLEAHYTLKFQAKLDYSEIILKVMNFGRFYGVKEYGFDPDTIENLIRTYKDYALHYKNESY